MLMWKTRKYDRDFCVRRISKKTNFRGACRKECVTLLNKAQENMSKKH